MNDLKKTLVLPSITLALLAACAPPSEEPATTAPPAAAESDTPVTEAAPADGLKNVYWGDTHLHTSYSPDAFLMQNRSADPDTAYRYARGLPVIHPLHRARIQIGTPLDFLVVSDHAEFMGVVPRRSCRAIRWSPARQPGSATRKWLRPAGKSKCSVS